LLSTNRNYQTSNQLRVDNPLKKNALDIELAVKELLQKLREHDINLSIIKVGDSAGLYQIELPEQKTSGLRARSARNRFGAPYSHLPQDKTMV
jgi:hypothetical protein